MRIITAISKRICTASSVWLFLAAPILTNAQPVEVIPAELHGAIQPQVAVAPNQKIYVAFGKGERVYCASSVDNGKTFLPPQEVARLPKLALGLRRGPRIVASDSLVTITAISHEDGNFYAWTSGDGGQTWSQGVVINSATNSAREGLHAMAGDGRGNVYAVWLDVRNDGKQIWGAGSRDGGRTWGGDMRIYQSPEGRVCECCHPSVEMETNGVIRAMWRNSLAGARDMYSAVSTDGGKTFGAAAKLGAGTWTLNGCPMDGGSVAGAYSAWRRGTSVYYTDGGPVEHLLGEGKQPIVGLGKGGAYFIWEENSRLMLEKEAAAPVVFSQAGHFPAMAGGSANRAPVVVWESTVDGAQTILAEALTIAE